MTEADGRRKVMAVGLDGLTLPLLSSLAATGELPTFGRLMADGAWGSLRSVGNTMTGPTWASVATGCRPTGHGVLHDYHHRADRYGVRQTTGADVRRPGLWQIASEAGRQVIVLNVPHTYPARPVSGVLLAGIDAPGVGAPGFEHPPGACERLRRAIGRDYVIDCGFQGYMQAAHGVRATGALADGVAAVREETEGRTRAAEHFLSTQDWDLLTVVYSLPDIWQHYFWHVQDLGAAVPGGTLVRDAYRTMDAHLARLIAHLPPGGLVVVFSDHGFGAATGSRAGLNDWLAARGWLRRLPARRAGVGRRLFRTGMGIARRRLGYRARQRVLSAVPGLRSAVEGRLALSDIDWPGTAAYAALDHREVWVNLRGRQPGGIVAPDDQARVCREIADALRAWREPTSGRAYVRAVDTLPYDGADVPDCVPPDLLIHWDPTVAPALPRAEMSGDHDDDGALLVRGAGVRAGRLAGAELVDVAPLVLAGLGIGVPGWMDGRIPPGVFA